MDHQIPSRSLQPRVQGAAIATSQAMASGSSLSTSSIALCAAGAVFFLLALGTAGYAYRKYRGAKATAQSLRERTIEAEPKLAPQHVLADPSIPTEASRSPAPAPPAVGVAQKPGNDAIAKMDAEVHPPSAARPGTASQSTAPSRPPRARIAGSASQNQATSTEVSTQRPARGAVPSLLIRSLGDLPPTQPSSPAVSSGAPSRTAAPTEMLKAPQPDPQDDDDESLTPILNLDFAFSDETKDAAAVTLEDQLDFEIERTRWMSSALSSAYEGRRSLKPSSRAPSRTSMTSSPTRSAPREVPPTASRSQSPSGSDGAAAPLTKSGKAFTAIEMPELPPPPKPLSADDRLLSASAFRLSLGLSFGRSVSQASLGSAVFGNIPSLWPDRSDESRSSSDLESGISDAAGMSRDWSNDGISHSSSSTSLALDPGNTSIAKATIVPAASLPPLPPFPRHLRRPNDQQAESATLGTRNKEAASNATATAELVPVPLRKRASTFGSSGELSALLRKDQMAAAIAAPSLPSDAGGGAQNQLHVGVAHVGASAISLPMPTSGAEPTKPKSGTQAPFMSPYHRAVFPDPPSFAARRSLDDQGRTSLQLQLAAFSPSPLQGSPRPRFSESLKARLSLSRKSVTGLPTPGSRENSPRLPQLEQMPVLKPSAGPSAPASAKAGTAPSPTMSTFFRPLRSLSRPSTAEDRKARRSPLVNDGTLPNESQAEQASPASAAQEKATTKYETGDSASPIMQPGRWAGGSGQDPCHPAVPNQTRPELQRIDLSVLQRHISVRSTSSTSVTSPLDEIEARLSMHIDATARPEAQIATHSSVDCENVAMEVINEEKVGVHSRSASQVSQATEPGSVRMSMLSTESGSATDALSMSSSCATDAMGADHDGTAVDRRARLLASVKQNLAKDREASRKAMPTNALHELSATIPEESTNFGLGLYSAEPEEEEGQEEQGEEGSNGGEASERLRQGGLRSLLSARSGTHRPAALNLVEKHAKLDNDAVAPLTPPYTPINSSLLPMGGAAQRQFEQLAQQSGHRRLELVSFGAKSTVVPIGRSRSNVDIATSKESFSQQRGYGARLSPLTGSPSTPTLAIFASNTDTPLLHAGYGTNSSKLRPLSLASSSTVLGGGNSSETGTPVLRKLTERAVFSPALSNSALSSPNPNFGGRVSVDHTSRRFSRSGPPAKGGVLPTVNSSGALQTGRAYHAELASSTSKDSMISSNNSFTSFSNGTCASSPARGIQRSLYGANVDPIQPPSVAATRATPQPAMMADGGRISNEEILADVLNHVDLASAIGI
ncbi:hypothetical protein ACQY0O_007657 [Thecaphora frezii]